MCIMDAVIGWFSDMGRAHHPLLCSVLVTMPLAVHAMHVQVTRDRMMLQLDKEYPQYGFAQHKGYGVSVTLLCIPNACSPQPLLHSHSPLAPQAKGCVLHPFCA